MEKKSINIDEIDDITREIVFYCEKDKTPVDSDGIPRKKSRANSTLKHILLNDDDGGGRKISLQQE